jgi:hypothetical protein
MSCSFMPFCSFLFPTNFVHLDALIIYFFVLRSVLKTRLRA